MQLGAFEPTSNSTTVLPYRHARPRRSAISNPDRTPRLNLDLLTLGSVHADGLPWTISLPILVINSSSCFLSAARTNKQTPTNKQLPQTDGRRWKQYSRHGYSRQPTKKVKAAHIRLPSVRFRSWSRFLAVSQQVTWVINPAVGCHYFPQGPQLPSQPLRGLLPFHCLVNRGTMSVNSFPKTVTRQRRGCDWNPGPITPESRMLTTRLPSHQPVAWITKYKRIKWKALRHV